MKKLVAEMIATFVELMVWPVELVLAGAMYFGVMLRTLGMEELGWIVFSPALDARAKLIAWEARVLLRQGVSVEYLARRFNGKSEVVALLERLNAAMKETAKRAEDAVTATVKMLHINEDGEVVGEQAVTLNAEAYRELRGLVDEAGKSAERFVSVQGKRMRVEDAQHLLRGLEGDDQFPKEWMNG